MPEGSRKSWDSMTVQEKVRAWTEIEAYQLAERAGKSAGDLDRFWHQAEREGVHTSGFRKEVSLRAHGISRSGRSQDPELNWLLAQEEVGRERGYYLLPEPYKWLNQRPSLRSPRSSSDQAPPPWGSEGRPLQ